MDNTVNQGKHSHSGGLLVKWTMELHPHRPLIGTLMRMMILVGVLQLDFFSLIYVSFSSGYITWIFHSILLLCLVFSWLMLNLLFSSQALNPLNCMEDINGRLRNFQKLTKGSSVAVFLKLAATNGNWFLAAYIRLSL